MTLPVGGLVVAALSTTFSHTAVGGIANFQFAVAPLADPPALVNDPTTSRVFFAAAVLSPASGSIESLIELAAGQHVIRPRINTLVGTVTVGPNASFYCLG